MSDVDVLVVGGGPAGLAAALEARRAGAAVALVDEYAELGGQFYRQPLHGRRRGHAIEGARLIAEVEASGVDVRTSSLVWGLSDDGRVDLLRVGRRERIRAKAVVLATGAVERVIPFPGWTKPGVFSPGGAQTLAKWQGVLPGARVIVAGSGPFLLPVATDLADAGAHVVGVFEATDAASLARGASAFRRSWGRVREALSHVVALRRRRIPVHFGQRIVAVAGEPSVERAIVARVDRRWHPIAGSERSIAVDAVCVGDGFVPATQLARLFGCAHEFRADDGGWCVVHDKDQATSVPGVFVAGEAGGIAGAHAAIASGRVAGTSAARVALGADARSQPLGGVCAALSRHRAFATALNALYRVPSDAYAVIPDGLVVCRCEDVTAGEVRRASHSWSAEANVMKGVTRVGMGPCQGRTCATTVASLVARATETPERTVGTFRTRAPVRPIPLSVLLGDPDAS